MMNNMKISFTLLCFFLLVGVGMGTRRREDFGKSGEDPVGRMNFTQAQMLSLSLESRLEVLAAKREANQDTTVDEQEIRFLENEFLQLVQDLQQQDGKRQAVVDTDPDCVNLPLILDVALVTSLAGYQAAVQYVNDYTDYMRYLKLCPVPFYPTSISDQRVYLDTMWNIANDDSYLVAVGPETSQAEVAGLAATIASFPFVSGSATSAKLEQVSLYDTFWHCAGPEEVGGFSYAYALEYYGLKDIAIIAQINGEGGTSTVNTVSALLRKSKELGIEVHHVTYVDLSVFDEHNPGNLWDDIRATGVRVIIAITNADSQPIFRSALEFDMTGFPYIWYISRSAVLGLCCEISVAGWIFNRTRIESYENSKVITHPLNAETDLGFLAYDLVDNLTAFGVGTSFRQFDAVVAVAKTISIVIDELESELGRRVTPSDLNSDQRERFLSLIGTIRFDGSQGNNQTFDPVTHVRVPEKWAQFDIPLLTDEGLFLPEVEGEYVDGEGYDHLVKGFRWTPGYKSKRKPGTEPVKPRDVFMCEDSNTVYDKKGIIIPDRLDDDNVEVILGVYQCDDIIDCDNWEDEGFECSTSLKTIEIIMGSLAGFVIVIIFISAGVILFARDWGRVRARGTAFLFFSSLGAIIGLISIFPLFGRASDGKCMAFPWLINVGASMLIGGLVAKQYRVFKIFLSRKFEAVIVTNMDLCAIIGLLIVPELILLVVLTVIDGLEPELTEIDEKYHYVCTSDNAIVWLCLFVVYKFLLLAVSSILAVRTRKVPTAFSEGQVVGYALYNALFSIAVFVPIVASQWTSEPLLSYIILYLGILWWFSSTYFILYAPLWYGLFCDRNADDVDRKKLPSAASTRSGTGTASTFNVQ